MGLNDLHSLVATKRGSEYFAIIAEGKLNGFYALIADALILGPNQESYKALVHVFVLVSLMEATVARVIKNFLMVTNPFNGSLVTLIGGRGLYTEDKQKRDVCERKFKIRAEKEAKALKKAQDLADSQQAAEDKDRKKSGCQNYDDDERSDASCHEGKHQPSGQWQCG